MSQAITLFALVSFAGFVVGVLSLIFSVNSNSRSRRLQMIWETSKPAKLALEVADLHGALEAVKRSHRSELGRVWQKFDGITNTATPYQPIEIAAGFGEGPTCDNWLAAQLEGPRSKAAGCQCTYCLTQRASRAAEKARILAERNRAKANGSE